jgi:hypothetical protein
MKWNMTNVVSMTGLALVVYLVVTNGPKTAQVIAASGNAYATGVKAFTNPTGVVGNATRR